MRQVVNLDSAIRALRLPYLYELTQPDPEKRKKREQIGLMLSDLLVDMRAELITCVDNIK
jgi:hypothetical protein